jgi:hypothetical protein
MLHVLHVSSTRPSAPTAVAQQLYLLSHVKIVPCIAAIVSRVSVPPAPVVMIPVAIAVTAAMVITVVIMTIIVATVVVEIDESVEIVGKIFIS